MTYDKLIYDIPTYQEGNLQDFEFEIDVEFPIDSVSNITLQVRNMYNNEVIIEKALSDDTITLVGRVISITFEPEDTVGFDGTHNYEIDFINATGKPFATIGGTFTISKEINTYAIQN